MANIKYGKVYYYKQSTFYAASGSIVFHDDRTDDSCNIMSISTFEFRLAALAEMLDKLRRQASTLGRDVEMKRDLSRMLGDGMECVREAREQGDPMDPTVQKWYKTHMPWKNGRVSMTGGTTDTASYEVGKPEPLKDLRGPDTGRTDKE